MKEEKVMLTALTQNFLSLQNDFKEKSFKGIFCRTGRQNDSTGDDFTNSLHAQIPKAQKNTDN